MAQGNTLSIHDTHSSCRINGNRNPAQECTRAAEGIDTPDTRRVRASQTNQNSYIAVEASSARKRGTNSLPKEWKPVTERQFQRRRLAEGDLEDKKIPNTFTVRMHSLLRKNYALALRPRRLAKR